MSDKREIARQDVLLTPKGPVELYRRDANGKEKYIRSNSVLNIDHKSKSLIDKIYSRGTLYDDYSVYGSNASRSSSLYRDPKGRYGVAFDWYDTVGARTEVLHEDVEVLPSRRSHYDTYKSSYAVPNSYQSDDSTYDDEGLFNKRDYNIYQYYEYEVEDEDPRFRRKQSPRKRTIVRSMRDSRSPTPIPPIAPARHSRRARKIISYIDYDTQNETNNKNNVVKYRNKNERVISLQEGNKSPSLSSSASGKELWKKVDKYSRVWNGRYFLLCS